MYQNFIGIDIGKFETAVAVHGKKGCKTYPDTPGGFTAFARDFRDVLKDGLVVLETTGGYEKLFLDGCLGQGTCVHRADTRLVKSFIRSLGVKGKTDAVDAAGLARYGEERHRGLALYRPRAEVEAELKDLAGRRADSNKIPVQEKNRLQAPAASPRVRESCREMIAAVEKQPEALEECAAKLLESCPVMRRTAAVLEGVPGIGKVISVQLAVLLPELGGCDRRRIASLAGLAPHPRDSGTMSGHRRIYGGRADVRRVLFMAAMAASCSKSALGDFYRRLVAGGKKKMVALTALMRKILVIECAGA